MFGYLLGILLPMVSADQEEFDFYLAEFSSHEMKSDEKLASLITDRLADALFNTSEEAVVKQRVRAIQFAFKNNPTHLDRFDALNQKLEAAFNERISRARRVRLYYAAGGAVVGGLVAIPVTRLLFAGVEGGGSIIANQVLMLSIPAGALAGGSLGYLLGSLLAFPEYSYDPETFNSDLEIRRKEIEQSLDPN